jgi:hypothetical protein
VRQWRNGFAFYSWDRTPELFLPSNRPPKSLRPCDSHGVLKGLVQLNWFSVNDEEQERRFQERIHNPVKRWKLSTMDLESRRHWVEYSKAKDVMLAHTDREKTPWWVVNADDKKRARLNCIAHLLKQIPYHDMAPVEIEIPPRQDDIGYKRPKKSNQRFVPEVY